MYHTFQASAANGSEGESGKSSRPTGGSRRISTSNACVECRRRKIRCDGNQPCGQCQWYQHPELCTYQKPAQRVIPSRKLVDKLQSQVDQYHSVFHRLFPGKELEDFLSLSREGLINLAVTLPAPHTSPGETPDAIERLGGAVQKSEGAESLEALEQAPEQDPETDEAKRLRDKIQGISDDVNGLSLSVDRASTYVGISSINAAMKVIFKAAPIARPFIAQASAETTEPSRSSTPPPQYVVDPDPNYLPPADVGERLIDSYFAHIHVLMPLIDEDQFRHSYLYGTRRDSPYLALLNMVMALGALASSTCESEDHIAFYQRARKHLDVEGFGSGSLFVLQASALLSGYYLHWLNRPNEANGIMGATLRMATAHGLHREYSDSHRSNAPGGTVIMSGLEVPVEIRRRTWWSLYILDSWASITTGRPSLGRTGDGITIQTPRVPEQMNNAQYLASLRLLPIIHNISFCKIATKVQNLLAAHSMIGFDELFALDAELEKWHDELPPILADVVERHQQHGKKGQIHGEAKTISPQPSSISTSKVPFDFSQPPDRDKTACPEVLKTPRAIMHWRYQNLRILMHRPILLATTLKRTPYASMSTEEKLAVGRCRIVAGHTITDINDTAQESPISGWNAVWMMYQAVMIPLVSLFSVLALPPTADAAADSPNATPGGSESSTIPGSDDDVDKWRREIELSIEFFGRMTRWSVAAKKSRDVVQRLYDATKYVSEHHAQLHQQQQQMMQRRDSLPALQVPESNLASNGMISPVGDPYAVPFGSQENAFLQSQAWSSNLNAEAAMNEFWDGMMWESFPGDLSDAANFAEGMESMDWWQQTPVDQTWMGWGNNGHSAAPP